MNARHPHTHKVFPRWRSATAGLAAAISALALLLAPTANAEAACPNEAIREAQGSAGFPGCMALEMVSPPRKFVEPATLPTFSVDGERIRFVAMAGLGGTPGMQAPFGDSYVATRGASGWVTAPTSPPASAEIFAGGEFGGGPYTYGADQAHWNGIGGKQTQANAGILQVYRGGLDGSFSPLSPPLIPLDNSGTEELFQTISLFQSTITSADLSTTLFTPGLFTTSFLPGDPSIDGGVAVQDRRNSYVISLDEGGEPSVELLARDSEGNVYGGKCGATAGGGFNPASVGQINQGAISPDGSRIYFSTRPAQPFDPAHPEEAPGCNFANPLRILERVSTPAGPEIAELIPGGPVAGDDLFQGASGDGAKVYLTTTRSLAASDLDSGSACSSQLGASVGCDLYLYDSTKPPGERLTLVSAGAPAGKSANVLSSITALSGDGSHVYFVAQGVLTGENVDHKSPAEGKPNLYIYERDAAHPAGHTAFIGTLGPGDVFKLWGTERSFIGEASAVPLMTPDRKEVGGDGHILAFATEAALTADDNDGGLRDVYRYDADSEALLCVSCASNGEPKDVSVSPIFSRAPSSAAPVEGRWVSEDGQEIGFASAEPLLAGDADKAVNPYLWRQGQLVRIPATIEEDPTISPDGSEIGFATQTALLPFDIDTASDVYVLRAGGGFPNPPPPNPDCFEAGTCQGARTSPPAALPPAFSGPGNPKPRPGCKKGFVKKRGSCAKPTRKKGKKRRAGNKQGGSK